MTSNLGIKKIKGHGLNHLVFIFFLQWTKNEKVYSLHRASQLQTHFRSFLPKAFRLKKILLWLQCVTWYIFFSPEERDPKRCAMGEDLPKAPSGGAGASLAILVLDAHNSQSMTMGLIYLPCSNIMFHYLQKNINHSGKYTKRFMDQSWDFCWHPPKFFFRTHFGSDWTPKHHSLAICLGLRVLITAFGGFWRKLKFASFTLEHFLHVPSEPSNLSPLSTVRND